MTVRLGLGRGGGNTSKEENSPKIQVLIYAIIPMVYLTSRMRSPNPPDSVYRLRDVASLDRLLFLLVPRSILLRKNLVILPWQILRNRERSEKGVFLNVIAHNIYTYTHIHTHTYIYIYIYIYVYISCCMCS